jgi:8-oxo-dGTP pyrophosphatase MutT (NUDIX family)
MSATDDRHEPPTLPPARWEVLDTEYLYQRKWLTLRRDRVQVPNGAILDEYYVLEYPTWVNVVAVTDDNQIVLIQQYRHGLGETRYELPAGVVDPDDPDPLTTAKRELLEETGYGGGTWSPLLVSSANPGTHNNLSHSFLALGVAKTAEPTPEDTEDIQVSVVTLRDARSLVDSGAMIQSLHLAPLLKFFLTRAEGESTDAERS